MFVKQLSVFIENREGRLEGVTACLLKNNINIHSMSLADTTEYGMLRMIVSSPEKAAEVLKADGFSAKLVDVVAVKIGNEIGSLQKFLQASTKLNIEYMYALATSKESASIIVKYTDPKEAVETLKDNEYIDIYTPEEVYGIY